MNEPQKLLIRKKDVMLWTGITRYEYDALVSGGVIVGVRFKEGGRLYFSKQHIFEKLIKPSLEIRR